MWSRYWVYRPDGTLVGSHGHKVSGWMVKNLTSIGFVLIKISHAD
jgi:hypothetical protein